MYEQVLYVDGMDADDIINKLRDGDLETVLDELSVLYETGTHPLVDNYDEIACCAQVHTYERWVLIVSTSLRYAALYYNIKGEEL